ncbi:uncharacterized protein LOC108101471 [Drosophila ficusphila]|uniref:uncharacterized protein LOC108101471 n=1 Tax=Drosophila ficusphila TaxID=30025 RepID=UPI0007E8768B|nr:uncharacterized protein LOC108101471 [Drosophila ficusphila]
MIQILKRLRGKGISLVRGFQTRPNICQKSGEFVHPELRRTIPLVYFSQTELPYKLDFTLATSKGCQISPFEKKRRSNEYFKEFCKKQRNCFSSTYYWSEFRRKMIYGSY